MNYDYNNSGMFLRITDCDGYECLIRESEIILIQEIYHYSRAKRLTKILMKDGECLYSDKPMDEFLSSIKKITLT